MTTTLEAPAESVSAATDRWLAAVPAMPPLTGAGGTAERLLLLLHYGIDWADGWVTGYRATYWDRLLPDRVITATYRAAGLSRWWTDVAAELDSAPRSYRQRLELQHHLGCEQPRPVLELLRTETTALVLRTRITAEHVRAARVEAS